MTAPAPRPRRVRPYPLHELPRLLRVQVELAQVFWRHLSAVLDAAAAGVPHSPAAMRLRGVLGGRLALRAHDPYLYPLADLPARIEGTLLLRLERLFAGTVGPTHVVLALDPGLLDQHPLLTDEESLAEELALALQGAPLRVTGPCAPADALRLLGADGTHGLALDLSVETGQGTFFARLLCSASLRLSWPAPAAPARARPAPPLHRLFAAPVTAALIAGHGRLRAADIAGLAVGDVVFLDHFGPRPVVGGQVWLRLGPDLDFYLPARLDGEGVTLTGPFQTGFALRDTPMQTSNPVGPKTNTDLSSPSPIPIPIPIHDGEDTPQVLRELPVQIVCEIGRVNLTGREVLDLRPGTVLPVGRPLAGPVDLTVGGQVIARGELVDVEGEIGIRVVELPTP